MTINEAKKDLAKRLASFEIEYEKITGKTVDFQDLGRCNRIFLTVHGLVLDPNQSWESSKYWTIHGERHKGYGLNEPKLRKVGGL